MAKKFVVFIDTQADFMLPTGKLYVNGASHLVGPLTEFAFNLDPAEVVGALFTYDSHDPATYPLMPESKQFPIHCVIGTAGWENVVHDAVVDSAITTYNLIKGVFNMWEEPHVDLINGSVHIEREKFFTNLKLIDGVETIVIVGVAADFCVKWAADGFLKRGFNVEIPRALTQGILTDIDTVVATDYVGQNIRVI